MSSHCLECVTHYLQNNSATYPNEYAPIQSRNGQQNKTSEMPTKLHQSASFIDIMFYNYDYWNCSYFACCKRNQDIIDRIDRVHWSYPQVAKNSWNDCTNQLLGILSGMSTARCRIRTRCPWQHRPVLCSYRAIVEGWTLLLVQGSKLWRTKHPSSKTETSTTVLPYNTYNIQAIMVSTFSLL